VGLTENNILARIPSHIKQLFLIIFMEKIRQYWQKFRINKAQFSVQFFVTCVVIALAFFCVFINSFKTYTSSITIMVNAKSEVAAEQEEQIIGNMLEFHVKDTGIGIAAEYHQTIFERFRQVDSAKTRKYGGNGLGLAISKNLANLLGGDIWVESEVNKYSDFFFTIPIKPIQRENDSVFIKT